MKHIISLGAGVQSSTMALMAAHGEIEPMPDCAIFADTLAEPQEVYTWLDWLERYLPFPVYRVSAGDLEADSLITGESESGPWIKAYIPAYIGTVNEGHGLLGRKCTQNYKVVPLRRKARELAGITGKQCKETVVTQWLGISLDEMQRMKTSVEEWQVFRHPLIEKRMARWDCLKWMKNKGYPEPPRSACYFCPFHSNDEWRRLNTNDFERAVTFERRLQQRAAASIDAGKLKGQPFLHRDRVPLDQADLRSAEDHGQLSFLDECAGMCGV